MIEPKIDVIIQRKNQDGEIIDEIVKCNDVARYWTIDFLNFITKHRTVSKNAIQVKSVAVSSTAATYTKNGITKASGLPAESVVNSTLTVSDVDTSNRHIDVSATYEAGSATANANIEWRSFILRNQNDDIIAWLSLPDAQVTRKTATEIRTVIWRIYLGTSTQRSPLLDIVSGSSQAEPSETSTAWIGNVLRFIAKHRTEPNVNTVQIHEMGVGNGTTAPQPTHTAKSNMGSSASYVSTFAFSDNFSLLLQDPKIKMTGTFNPNNVGFVWACYGLFTEDGRIAVRMLIRSGHRTIGPAGSGITQPITGTSIPKVSFDISVNPGTE